MSGCHFSNAEPPPGAGLRGNCYFRKACGTPQGELLAWGQPGSILGTGHSSPASSPWHRPSSGHPLLHALARPVTEVGRDN